MKQWEKTMKKLADKIKNTLFIKAFDKAAKDIEGISPMMKTRKFYKMKKKSWRDLLIEKFDRWLAISIPKEINREPVDWWTTENKNDKKDKK